MTLVPPRLRVSAFLLISRTSWPRTRVWVTVMCRPRLFERVPFLLFIGALRFPGTPVRLFVRVSLCSVPLTRLLAKRLFRATPLWTAAPNRNIPRLTQSTPRRSRLGAQLCMLSLLQRIPFRQLGS